jgi:hypothetical protein
LIQNDFGALLREQVTHPFISATSSPRPIPFIIPSSTSRSFMHCTASPYERSQQVAQPPQLDTPKRNFK